MILLILLLVHISLLINTQFTLWPEMVIYPYLINNGFVLYKEIINPYPPLFSYFLAFFSKFFDYNIQPFQFLTWITIVIIDVLIFYIATKLYKKSWYANIAVIFFILLSTAFGINGLWFDLIQTPLILLSVFSFHLFLKTQKHLHLTFSIIFLTIAFFIKQQIIWLALLYAVVILIKHKEKTLEIVLKSYRLILFFALILTFQLLFFWQKNALPDLLYWTLFFPFIGASHAPGYVSLPTIKQLLVSLSLFVVFIPTFFKAQEAEKFFIGTSIVLLLFAFPRFDYFHLIPALSVLLIVFGKNLKNLKSQKSFLKFISISALLLVTIFSVRFVQRNWHKETRFFEKEIFATAKVIDLITEKNERIYIQNGPDQVLPIAQRLPPKPWADEFPWYLEKTNLQDRVIRGIKEENTRLILFKPYAIGQTYDLGSYQPKKIVDVINKNYKNLSRISDSLWLKSKK